MTGPTTTQLLRGEHSGSRARASRYAQPIGTRIQDVGAAAELMTLIFTLATQEYVAQVSDRRQTWHDSCGRVRRCDDESNKAILWGGHAIIAYTGLADLGPNRKTDLWAANVLSEIETGTTSSRAINSSLREFAGRCDREFAEPRNACLSPNDRRQSFLFTGWATRSQDQLVPYVAAVSNEITVDSQYCEPPAPQFRSSIYVVPTDHSYLVPAGVHLHVDRYNEFVERLEALLQAFGGHDAPITTMVEEVRSIAEQVDEVGTGIMVSILPRRAAVADGSVRVFWGGPSTEYAATFHYFPSDSDAPVPYGPLVVAGGIVAQPVLGAAPFGRRTPPGSGDE